MRMFGLALSGAVLLGSFAATAQQDARSGAVRPHSASTAAHVVQLAGRVSSDGRTLVSDEHDRWTVNNPKALQGHEGRWVNVKCQLSADQSSIHVLAVHSGESTATARSYGDAAFRR